MKKLLFASIILSIILSSCGSSESGNENNNGVELNESENNIEITTEKVEINGVEHFIKKMGKGEPIVVLHGGPGIFHDYLVPHFKKIAENYEVIFYDQRACGQTAFPSDTSSINIVSYVEDLEAIRTYLKIEKLNLLGHSWGALLAMKYGVKYPDNLNRLMLVSPAPANTNYFDETFANMQQKRSEADTKELIETMMSSEFANREKNAFRKVVLLGDKTNLADQTKIEELYKPMEFSETTANSMLIVNSLLERTYFNLDITNEGLNKITCSTIIILGDLDNVPFNSAQAIQDSFKNCKLKVLKKCGHYPFFESPKEFNTALNDFLDPHYDQ